MMADSICVRLPFLHPEKFSREAPFQAFHLCPGISGSPDPRAWRPAYPLSPAQAGGFLEDLGALGPADFDQMLICANSNQVAEEMRSEREMAELARFAAGAEIPASPAIGRQKLEHAQRMLIWLWFAEERALEIAAMEDACVQAEGRLLDAVIGEPGAGAFMTPAINHSLLPPWRACLASAALFLPLDAAIFAEGPMAEDLGEILDFHQPDPDAGFPAGTLAAFAPLWRVLGDRGRSGELGRIYEATRMWLIWSEA